MRILLADDQPEFRSGLRDLLSTVEGVEVVGEAATGEEAVQLASALRPDIVLMDIRMPTMDGIAATEAIRAKTEGVCVLVLTTFDEDDLVAAAIRAGALGYLLKGTPVEDMMDIVRLALRGYTSIGRGVRPGSALENGTDDDAAEIESQVNRLSERGREVWALVGEGFTNREVAKRLFLTEGTVKNYVSEVLGALGVRHRTQAALLWRKFRR